MKRHTKVVRVVLFHKDERQTSMLLEQFRYAGLIAWHKRNEVVEVDGCTSFKEVFDLMPRSDANSEIWAKQNAERMRSFGISAEVAPAMSEDWRKL